ncbi:MAG: hypothetical protein EOP04_02285 [Proteobacteria bacterium]|nr:MAG: hypothetical protein EOP04_02285 [Pseudomonadota bacterium]
MKAFIQTTLIMSQLLAYATLSSAAVIPKENSACMFYREFESKFWQCAAPYVRRKSCTIVKGACPACVKYKGDKGRMWLPDFFIEVTTNEGQSRFADSYPVLRNHIKHAEGYSNARTPLPPSRENTAPDIADHVKEHFWHARIVLPPWGSEVLQYLHMPQQGGSAAYAPLCFAGLSEYAVDQWKLGIADAPYAMKWAPVGLLACNAPGASIPTSSINAAISGAKSLASGVAGGSEGIGAKFGPLGCAYGVPGNVMLKQNLNPSSDALNFGKLCMGEMGNLIPREGVINNDDVFRSAVMAGWKFASLTKDAFLGSIGGIEATDKIQLVYPRSDMEGCYQPQTALKDWPLPGPTEKRSLGELGHTYIFAVWRERETTRCMEPGEADAIWMPAIKGANYQANRGLCK